MLLSLNNITKSYNNKIVISSLNLTIRGNTIYCLLGKNGAGKSTLINIIANVIEPTHGRVSINGLSYQNDEISIKRALGIQSQFNQIIGELNAYDFLEWIGLLYEMPKDEITIQTKNLLNYFFDESENLDSQSKTYSEGMKKKLIICSALIHKPQLLVLDEPFANLDPVAALKLCDFLVAYKSEQRIILVSSHDLLYVDKISTHIGVLNATQLVFSDTIYNFKTDSVGSIDKELLRYLWPEKEEDKTLLKSLI